MEKLISDSVRIEKEIYNHFTDTNLKREHLLQKYSDVRKFTEKLCRPLNTEDYVIQSMPDASPAKWHLAHTSWFFEEFVLRKVYSGYKSINPNYAYLFNSYYVQAGERWFRPHRGLLSRPTVEEIYEYRTYVDKHMMDFLSNAGDDQNESIYVVVNIGLNHEQQHQELLLTDIKHMFSFNPLYPEYSPKNIEQQDFHLPLSWIEFDEGISEIGHNGKGFYYDNEMPKHKEFIDKFSIASRLITNKEFIEFIEDGGYKNPVLWLSDGYAAVERGKWEAPLYWKKIEGEWWNYTLSGFRKVNPSEPVVHISYFEADAFAAWSGHRLPTEAEWEKASSIVCIEGNFVENENYHPVPLGNQISKNNLNQMFGDVWEWTRSSYSPYPGYKVPPGALGEYNGKFMSGQMVLRGGSCATSVSHIRNNYRNFFYPHSRWQFMGIRLAKNY